VQTIETALSRYNGKPLNYSMLARHLGISYHTVKRRIEELQELGFLRLLYCFPKAREAHGRRAPMLFMKTNLDFRTRLIEQIIACEKVRSSSSSFGYFQTYSGGHIDLILNTPRKRIGFIFSDSPYPIQHTWICLRRLCRRGWIDYGFVLYTGRRSFFPARKMVALPVGAFIPRYNRWLESVENLAHREILKMVRRWNNRSVTEQRSALEAGPGQLLDLREPLGKHGEAVRLPPAE
jgi:DNA-binding Lrp family transcriptional regulator